MTPREITTIDAESLWSKWGFGDGSPFGDVPKGIIEDVCGDADLSEVLEVLVRRHLIPEIERMTGIAPELTIVHGGHNRVRAVGYDSDPLPDGWSGIDVPVTDEDFRSAAAEVRLKGPH